MQVTVPIDSITGVVDDEGSIGRNRQSTDRNCSGGPGGKDFYDELPE